MKIAFYAASCLPVHAGTLDERPLGGTETGLIRLVEVLHRRGHEVVVFTAHPNPPQSRPAYVHFSRAAQFEPFDVFVLVKDWKPAFLNPRAKRIVYWTGDGPEQFVTFGLGDARVARKIDRLLVVSTWHRDSLCAASRFPIEKAAIIGNGVHLPYFAGAEPRARHRLIYTAAPYRGLQLIPPIYKALKSRFPQLELHVFAGLNVYDTDRPFQGPHVEQFEAVSRQLRALPGVVLHGNVRQAVLARELMRSAVFVYPNTVFETCCLTALEAQAAGCAIVASSNSALPETVGEAGFLVTGEPASKQYLQDFAQATARLLEDDSLWQSMSGAGLRRIQASATWDHVADRFEQAVIG